MLDVVRAVTGDAAGCVSGTASRGMHAGLDLACHSAMTGAAVHGRQLFRMRDCVDAGMAVCAVKFGMHRMRQRRGVHRWNLARRVATVAAFSRRHVGMRGCGCRDGWCCVPIRDTGDGRCGKAQYRGQQQPAADRSRRCPPVPPSSVPATHVPRPCGSLCRSCRSWRCIRVNDAWRPDGSACRAP